MNEVRMRYFKARRLMKETKRKGEALSYIFYIPAIALSFILGYWLNLYEGYKYWLVILLSMTMVFIAGYIGEKLKDYYLKVNFDIYLEYVSFRQEYYRKRTEM